MSDICEQVLLPSPNWFLTSVASCSANGALAYGSRTSIVVIRSVIKKDSVVSVPNFIIIHNAHREKVTTLAFCNRAVPEQSHLPSFPLASASEDGMVMIWNAEFSENIRQQREHREKVTGIDWTRTGDLLLVSADERGKIIVWNVLANTARSQQLLNSSRLSPLAIACSPVNQDIVAAGCKDGHVCILNIKGQGQLVSKLRGHDKSVVSVSWCPQTDSESPLLATGGLDKKIYIWKANDGVCVKAISLPTKQLGKGFKARTDSNKANVLPWLPVLWLSPTFLVSSSNCSELIAWNPMADKLVAKLLHSEHLRGLACIAAPPCKNDRNNWRSPEEPYTVWSMAQDRMLICTEISKSLSVFDATVEQAVEASGSDRESITTVESDTNEYADEVAKEAKELVNGTLPKGISVESTSLAFEAALEVNAGLEVETIKCETAKEATEAILDESAKDKMQINESVTEKVQSVTESTAEDKGEDAKEAVEIEGEQAFSPETNATGSDIHETVTNIVEKDEKTKEIETIKGEKPINLETGYDVCKTFTENTETGKGEKSIEEIKEEKSEKGDTVLDSETPTAVELATGNDEKIEDKRPNKEFSKNKCAAKKCDDFIIKTTIFPTLGGYVYFLAPCQFVPGRVAIGVGDDTIRVWNMNDTSCINVVCIWQRIKGKVMSLAWHPAKEGVLAFGTSEGRVGICNTSNPNKEPIVFRQFHRSTVYRVAWGPPTYPNNAEDQPLRSEICLYASDETVSVYYDPIDSQQGPIQLKHIIKTANPNMKTDVKHKEIAWKPDFSLLAIGLDDGCVSLFSAPHLQCIHTVLAHKKSIYFLLWHPQFTATDTGNETRSKNWLATSSVDQQINVFDFSPLISENKEDPFQKVAVPIEPFAEIKRGGKVVGLCWNPHISGQIASSSYDKTVKIWDVVHNQLLACYTGHSGCVLSCCWSVLDPDVMLSGSADFTARAWRISKSKPKEDILSKDTTNVASRIRKEEQKSLVITKLVKIEPAKKEESQPLKQMGKSSSQKKGANAANKKSQQKTTKLHMFPISSSSSFNKDNAIACCEAILQAKGVLPTIQAQTEHAGSVEADNIGDVSEPKADVIVEIHTNTLAKPEPSTVNNLPNLGYFTDQENFFAMLDIDERALFSSGNHSGHSNIKLWRGNLHETLKTAAQSKHLNDWLVSLAPNVSHKVWLEMCTAYANQLVEEEDFIKAASYLLVCHKVLAAVELLSSHGYYREAVVLCRCRLGPDDPTTKDTMLQWAKSATAMGSLELAIQCYVCLEDYGNAAALLHKRNDLQMWQLGALLAAKAGNTTLQLSLVSECFSACLQEEKWTEATQLIAQHPELASLQLLVEAHRLVMEVSKEEPPTADQLAIIWNPPVSKTLEANESPGLLHRICELCTSQENLYSKLITLLPPRTGAPEGRKELLTQLSRLLLLAAVARQEGIDDWERHVVEAMHMCYKRNLLCVKERPLQCLLWWLQSPILNKMTQSEKAFISAVMIDCLPKDSPEAAEMLLNYKEFLLDVDSALHSRLKVVVSNLEKEVATTHCGDATAAEKAKEALLVTRNDIDILEKDRVAFPNALVMFCKVQSFIEYFRQHDILQSDDQEAWHSDLTAYRSKLQM